MSDNSTLGEQYRGPHATANELWHEGLDISFHAALARGTPFAVMFVDLNNLKHTNDTLGHEAGDRAIALVAEVLEKQGTGAMRIGGDEFGIFRIASEDEVWAMEEAIREEVAARLQEEDNNDLREAGLGVAIGFSVFDPAVPNPDNLKTSSSQLLAKADDAMYHDKREQLPELNEDQEEFIKDLMQRVHEKQIRLRDLGKYLIKYSGS